MASSRGSKRLDMWIELTSELLHRPALHTWHLEVLPELSTTFGAPASWNWTEPAGGYGFQAVGLPVEWPPADLRESWGRHNRHHPLLVWYAMGESMAAQTLGRVPDFVVPRRDRSEVEELLLCGGVSVQMSLPMWVAGWEHRAFVLARAGDEFADEDLQLARQVQPLLRLVDRQARVLSELTGTSSATAELTGRERAVLVLLSTGLTARAISRRLGISERTVHAHLQHIYRKLGTCDRFMAVRVAEALGALIPPEQSIRIPETINFVAQAGLVTSA